MGIQLFDAHPLWARHRADAFPCGALLTKPMDSMLQMRKPRHREAKKKKKSLPENKQLKVGELGLDPK